MLLRQHGGSSAQRKVVIRCDGRSWKNLTRWLPAIVHMRGKEVVVEDDFSQLIAGLRARGARFLIRENARRQRALFVEE